jgi:type II secretory pathway pseudopilin PulG
MNETPNTTTPRTGMGAAELLFAILTIGILILVAVSFLNTSRMRARDAKRLVDVRRIQTALEFYRLENDAYPEAKEGYVLSNDQIQFCDKESGTFVPAGQPCKTKYMELIPSDPSLGSKYVYFGQAGDYAIQFTTEDNTSLGAAGTYFAHSTVINTVR